MSNVFGDDEPEDGWHPDDPFGVLVDNLFRRLALLEHETTSAIRHAQLDVIASRLSRYQRTRGGLSPRDQIRVDQLADDLALLRTRL